MEKIAINPNRLQWCMNTIGVDLDGLSLEVHIAKQTLEQVMENQAALSVNQLEKIANYFKRSLLFFLDPNEAREETIYSPQFRTINNQKPISSPKLRAFIERVEKQREVYLGLMEDLEEPLNEEWYPNIKWNLKDIKLTSAKARQWLGISISDNFDDIRQAVESKGIMVIVSNGYNGKWQIDKDNPVRGFSLYYNVLPVIVVKKQYSKGAQTFTLMHELAHLLLHKESAIDDEEDFHSYQGMEKEANEFAGNLLIPDVFLNELNLEKLLNLEVEEYDNYLSDYKKRWCVSGEAILVRLLINNIITQQHYQSYKNFKSQQAIKDSQKDTGPIPRKYRHREPMNVFGKPFVYAVFDSLHNRNITLAKASTYLDNLKISDVRQLERYV
ncbi:MAG: ImmA/IrrE family metallo-endopeptidase [Gammaproteobacteria bacterium]